MSGKIHKYVIASETKQSQGRWQINILLHSQVYVRLPTYGVPETGFLRKSLGENEVFSSKNPVSLVGCVSPVKFTQQCRL